jgi:2-dehydro-3-deoxyphosphogalactonate aldolase
MSIDELISAGAPPIVAILRGVRPDEVGEVAGALFDAGIRLMEVPLNSPDPLASVRALSLSLGAQALVGAGTVLSGEAVQAVAAEGGRLIVTPNTDVAVISEGVALGLEVMPGFLTPSEAFQAVSAGARRLKVFPASAFGASYLGAIREVLPRNVGLWAVGGVSPENLSAWLAAGAEGIGVGSALYRPGDSSAVVAAKARLFVEAWENAVK